MEDDELNHGRSEDTTSSFTFKASNQTIDYFIDEKIWDEIGKNLKDYNVDDMSKLAWKSVEDCEGFYNTYGLVVGFGVRKVNKTRSRTDGRIIARKMVCNKEGERRESSSNNPNRKRKSRNVTRVGCGAYIKFKYVEEGKYWIVDEFERKHDHDLVEQRHIAFMRRQISEADKIKVMSMHNSGIATCDIMRNMIDIAGSQANVGHLPKDLYNFFDKVQREEVKDGDAETVMAYLDGKRNVDPLLFVRYTRDEEGRLEKLFWCDGKSRADYKAFGHVLAFDCTYRCNAYNKPFVVLVGVNHHRKTVPFGCALIVHEKEDTYSWVLEQLIEAGDGYKPLTVITDGDKAMANAIKKVLPESRHRLCLWHLLRNVKANSNNKQFCNGFMKCVDKYLTTEDFENAWKELVEHHGFQERKWVKDLYDVKEKWAEAYLKGYFFAGMRSTQRCESMHSSLKKVLHKKLMLYKFIEYYDKAVAKLRWEENHQDYKTTHESPFISGVLSSIKHHAAELYTMNSFSMLCEEMKHEAHFVVKDVIPKTEEQEPQKPIFYWLNAVENQELWYVVVRHDLHGHMSCCCMKLESLGCPCRHMFAVMKYANIEKIPERCIFNRWTKNAIDNYEGPTNTVELDGRDEAIIMARYADLSMFWPRICHGVAQSLEAFREVKATFVKLCLKFGSDTKVKNPQYVALGIGDPKVVENGRGHHSRKGKSGLATSIPCYSRNPKKVSTENKCAPKAPPVDRYMPNTYTQGSVNENSYFHELAEMDEDPTVFDWNPKKEW